ncbi:MAG TPA: RDD family protein [Candidatus Binatia bacterium]|jgi:uncharacterized RDD family membrane protein YckC
METGNEDAPRLRAVIEREYDRLYARLNDEEAAAAVLWGGFFRRLAAFMVDMFVLGVFSLLLFRLSGVGFRVGMAAHAPTISFDMWEGVARAAVLAWIVLAASYFVVLHAHDGSTVGQWLFGLRVVDRRREPVGYGRALWRWIVSILTWPLLIGYLRILWHREKRGWHDSLAGTWVVRE